MMEQPNINTNALTRLESDQREFINVLGTMRGTNIYEAGFTIAVHSRVYDMIAHNSFNKNYLEELILRHESPIVNIISGDYVLQGNTDFTNLETFVNQKLEDMWLSIW